MMPPIVTIIPLYLAFNYLDMLNTKWAVVIAYTAFNLPFATWMMKSYFQDLPVELEEAAMVDGDTRWGAFLRVALPLARPGLAATAIFCLIISWNRTCWRSSDADRAIANASDRHRRARDTVQHLLGRD
jgi:multiple sugar transport system permease protein